MRNLVKIITGGAALAALATNAHAQASASATATGSVTIIQPIAVTETANLAFGKIVKPSTGTNTVTVTSTGGTRSITGGGNAVIADATGVSSAAFNVTGEGAQVFNITVPSSFNMTSGANTLVVTTTASATSGTLSGSIGSTGSLTFGVGGSFPLTSTSASGAYSGTFVVTVAYN